jgi:hypothetical protein
LFEAFHNDLKNSSLDVYAQEVEDDPVVEGLEINVGMNIRSLKYISISAQSVIFSFTDNRLCPWVIRKNSS